MADQTYRALYAYPWDLAELPGDAAAELLADAGLNTVTLACAYHAGKFMRPHGRSGKVMFPEDGVAYFRARAERYQAIAPDVSRLTSEHDVLDVLCRRDDLRVNAWVVLLHNTRLGMAHPEAVVRNAFGDPYWYSLCPANPDARAYAVALCDDLASGYGVTGLSIETPGFLPFAHGFHHEFALVPLNAWVQTLLALCFCAHCEAGAAAAGIDVAGLRSRVSDAIAGYLESDIAPETDMAAAWWPADVVADAELAAFLRWRCGVVTSLVGEIRAAVRTDATVAVIPSVQRPSSLCWLEGSDLAALADDGTVLEVALYEPSPERIRDDLWDVRRRAGAGAKLRAILRPGPPDMESAPQAVASIRLLKDAGISDFAFYNYGHLRAHAMNWVRDALQASEL